MNSHDTVITYFRAWTSGDVAAARTLLADDLRFEGPMTGSTKPMTWCVP